MKPRIWLANRLYDFAEALGELSLLLELRILWLADWIVLGRPSVMGRHDG